MKFARQKLSLVALFSFLSLSLTACATLQQKLADAQIFKSHLADGSVVYGDINVFPTPEWNCQEVGMRQGYNWAELQMETQNQLYWKGPYNFFFDKAIKAANMQDIHPNYINLKVPDQKLFEFASDARMTTEYNLDPNARAIAVYYTCQRINPEHKLMHQGGYEFGVGVGAGADNLD